MENLTGIDCDSAVISDVIFESELRLCCGLRTGSIAALGYRVMAYQHI